MPSVHNTDNRHQVAATIVAYDKSLNVSLEVPVPDLPVPFPLVDRLPGDAFLVAGARCALTDAGPELNALVIDRDGNILRRGCLGDGLERVQTTGDGVIWAGYFDEGVFGNLGWGVPNGPRPLGAGGLVAWSSTFEKLWELDHTEVLVAGCEVLNVTDDSVWASPDRGDFPIVRIHEQQVVVNAATEVAAPNGIVTAGDLVALIGNYRDPSLLVVGHLAEGKFVEQQRTHLRMANGSRLRISEVQCRGAEAHFFAGRSWFSFDLNDLK